MSNTTRCDVCNAVMGEHEHVGPFSKLIGKKAGRQHRRTRSYDDFVHIHLHVGSKHDVCAKCQKAIVGLK